MGWLVVLRGLFEWGVVVLMAYMVTSRPFVRHGWAWGVGQSGLVYPALPCVCCTHSGEVR